MDGYKHRIMDILLEKKFFGKQDGNAEHEET